MDIMVYAVIYSYLENLGMTTFTFILKSCPILIAPYRRTSTSANLDRNGYIYIYIIWDDICN